MYRSYGQLGDQPEQNRDLYNVVELTNLNHKNDVIRTNRVVCIDYYADWCGPCKQTASPYSVIANNYHRNGECAVVKYNIDKIEPSHPDRKLITGIPAFHFYVDGKLVDNVIGGDIQAVEDKLKSLLGGNTQFTNSGPQHNRNSIRNTRSQLPSMNMNSGGQPYQSNSGNYHQPYQTY
jgi:thioredoxin 1